MTGGIPSPQVVMLLSRYFQTVGAFPSRHPVQISFLTAPYLLTSVKGWVGEEQEAKYFTWFSYLYLTED